MMRITTCIQNCDDQMLTQTRFLSKDIFDFSNTSGIPFNIKLTESKSLIHYLIVRTSGTKTIK